jgi:hypothetical protein
MHICCGKFGREGCWYARDFFIWAIDAVYVLLIPAVLRLFLRIRAGKGVPNLIDIANTKSVLWIDKPQRTGAVEQAFLSHTHVY